MLSLIEQYSPFEPLDAQAVVQKVAAAASQFGAQLLNISAKLLGDATNFVISFMLMLFVLFFLLRDHKKMVSAIRHVLPLSRSQEDAVLTEVEQVAKSAVLGSFLTALAQGFAGGFAMWLAGFPRTILGLDDGFCLFYSSIRHRTYLAACRYLPAADQPVGVGAVFGRLGGIIVVGSIDNILRPLLMQGNSSMNTLMIFFSILGGLHLFGLIGLIYGPIIFAVTLVLFKLYEVEFKDFLDNQDHY